MELLIYQEEYKIANSIDHFLNFYFGLRMRYLASDLLQKGLSPESISDAVIKAMRVGKASGLNIKEHFLPVFSGSGKGIIRDCKLSVLGYGLVLMNADVGCIAVARWQRKILENFLEGEGT